MSWVETLIRTVSAAKDEENQAGDFEEDDELDLDDGEEFSDEDFEDDDDEDDDDDDDDDYDEWEEEFDEDEPERHHRPEWH